MLLSRNHITRSFDALKSSWIRCICKHFMFTRLRSYFHRVYIHQTISIHFPNEHITIQIQLSAPYIMERPFIPFSNTHFLHPGIDSLTVDCIFHQTKIDLSLLLPMWNCRVDESNSKLNENVNMWMALLRYLSSTTSCMQLHCLNNSRMLID